MLALLSALLRHKVSGRCGHKQILTALWTKIHVRLGLDLNETPTGTSSFADEQVSAQPTRCVLLGDPHAELMEVHFYRDFNTAVGALTEAGLSRDKPAPNTDKTFYMCRFKKSSWIRRRTYTEQSMVRCFS